MMFPKFEGSSIQRESFAIWIYCRPTCYVCIHNMYYIYIYYNACPLKTITRRHTHICHIILFSFPHPFILTLINLLGIWLRMLPLGQVKAEYTFLGTHQLEGNALPHCLFCVCVYYFFFCFLRRQSFYSSRYFVPPSLSLSVCLMRTLLQTMCRHSLICADEVYCEKLTLNGMYVCKCCCHGFTGPFNYSTF